MLADTLLEVDDLAVHFPIQSGWMRRTTGAVRAVDGVSFTIGRGEILGLVGESGSGKTTIGRAIMRAYEPTRGTMLFRRDDGDDAGDGGIDAGTVDLATVPRKQLRAIWREIQMIFQDPFSSLNPRMTLLQTVGEPLRNYGVGSAAEIRERAAELLATVGLRPEYLARYPHAFSGGQRQRIVVARALALRPKLIVCDEPTSALDVSIQAQVLNLLLDLQAEFHLSYLFISHDLTVVEHLCDRIAVLYAGKLVELAPRDELFDHTLHPYTEALLSAAPIPDPRRRRERIVLQGDVPDPANPPPGCAFAERCRYAVDHCRTDTPELRELRPGHWVSCHRADELTLASYR